MLVVEETKPIKISANADLILPHSPLILPPRDDTAEYDDTGDTYNLQDDPKYVSHRGRSRTRKFKTNLKLCVYAEDFLLITMQFLFAAQIHFKGMKLTPENLAIYRFYFVTRNLHKIELTVSRQNLLLMRAIIWKLTVRELQHKVGKHPEFKGSISPPL